MKRRILSIAVAMVMCLALLPAPAGAANPITQYIDKGDVTIRNAGSYIITQTDPSTPTQNTITINPTASGAAIDITLKDVNIDASQGSYSAAIGVYNGAQVTITLEGNNFVKSPRNKAGIFTNEYSNSLTIRGEGSLEAWGGDYGAGIGGALMDPCGTIQIEGGTIRAYGGKGAAGIGGGDVIAYGSKFPSGGVLVINILGGTIYAEGKENPNETNEMNPYGAAGIGGGYFGGNTTINISGGDITAAGAAKSPCVGCSNYARITISGGTIRAVSNPLSREIGSYMPNCDLMTSTKSGNSIIYVSGPNKISSWYESSWNGVVWEGAAGKVCGSVDLTGKDFTIAAGETLTVPGSTEGENPTPTLIISQANFHNNGTITGTGMVRMDGKDYRIENNTLVPLGEVVPPEDVTITISGDPSKTYDGQPAVLGENDYTVTPANVTAAVEYAARQGAEFSSSAPINAGEYTVRVTAGGQAATKDFTISKATPSVGSVTCGTVIYPSTDPATVSLSHSGAAAGTVKFAEGTTFTPGAKDYEWVFIPADAANYESVTGTIRLTVGQPALNGIAVTSQPAKVSYTFGEPFDPAGMTVTATYADGARKAVTPAFDSVLAVGQTTLALSYTEGGVTRTCTLSGLTVNKKPAAALTASDEASYSDTAAQTFHFGSLLPSDCGAVTGVTVGSVSASAVLASATGDKDAKTVTWALKPGLDNEEKSEVVTVTVQTENYEDITIALTVRTTAKKPVTITGVEAQDGTYNGTAHAGYTGTPAAAGYDGEFTITYSGGGAPKNAGTYTVTFAVPANNPDCVGSKTLTFTVEKAKIDITANDRIVTVGGTMPTLTATVSGLVAGDTLKTKPAVTCDSDLSTVGTFPIKVSGAEVPEGGNYESGITYHDGTLTVRAATDPADLTETGLVLWTGRNGNDGPTPSGRYTAGGGTVEWDLSTLTLTLNNATMNATDAQFGNALEIVQPSGGCPEVTIVLNGINTIRGKDDGYSYGINSQCPLRISGGGTLTAAGGDTSVGASIGISCDGLTVERGAVVNASGGSSSIHSIGLSSTDTVTVAGSLKAVAGNGSPSFGMLVNHGLVVERGGVLEARSRINATQSYGISFNGSANTPVTVNGTLTAIGFAPLGGGSAQYQNRVTVKGSYSEDGSGLFGFATNPTSFEANYQANNPKYILIQPGTAPTPDTPSSGGSSSGTSSTTTTTKNPDGSVTDRTENRVTGTVTTTTRFPDGSQTVVEAKKDGSSVTKVTQKDGTTATVNTDARGRAEAEVKLAAAVVSSAQESGAAVSVPIPPLRVERDLRTASTVTVRTGSQKEVKVEIPVTAPTPGTVAVLVKADGTEEVVKTSVPTKNGVSVSLPDGAMVKLVDNSKTFVDVSADNWAADAVSFSSARGLFAGTSATTFAPEAPMTRAMLVTVLARFDGVNTSGGSTWYQKGVDWAVANGISNGSDLSGNVTREQIVVMLWRYSGSPAASGTLNRFADAHLVSGYAQEAMRWAVENGIISGFGNGQLSPQGQATRAQAAQLLKNFIEK